MQGFKEFLEDTVNKMKKDKPESYLDGIWRELNIDPNSLPEFIESGPIELTDEGLWFNQAIWQIIKPIDLKDSFVRLKFHKSLSPNLDQRCYVRGHDGKMKPFPYYNLENKIFLIPIDKFANMLGKGWQQMNPMGGGM